VLARRSCSGRIGRGRRVASWTLVVLALLAAHVAGAQSPRRTTVGRLLGGPVDTIEVDEYHGGELGGRGAQLRLVRAGAGFTGTLRLTAVLALRSNTPDRRCDTVVTASMSAAQAKRVLAFIRPIVIEPGHASDRLPVTDVIFHASARLTSGSNAITIWQGSTVVHGEARYRTPLKRDRTGRTRPPSQFLDWDTPLGKAHEMLQPYLELDRVLAFQRACEGG
jgi:hypothetical protein